MDKGMILSKNDGQKAGYIVLIKNMVLAYLVSLMALLIVAFLLYKLRISERTVEICMIMIYVGSTFFAGFLSGGKLKKMKFLWGLLAGVLYFAVLVILSMAAGREAIVDKNFWLTWVLCAGGGMLGGMLST